MNETLFIRLVTQPSEPIFWLVWSDAENEIIASGQIDASDGLASLSSHGNGRKVVAFAPGHALNFKTIPLPGKLNKQLQAAAPYIIEEELAQDVDDLFFAFGDTTETSEGPAVNVAIVDREQLEAWLTQLEDAELFCHSLIPDVLCLPAVAEHWSMLELNDQWLLRQGDWKFITAESSWVASYLSIATQQMEDKLKLATFSPFIPATQLSKRLDIAPQPEELALKLLALNSKQVTFNLIQGEYIRKTGMSKYVKIWKNAAIAAGVALCLSLVQKVIELNQLENEITAQDTQIIEQYKTVYPKAKPRIQLIRKVLDRELKNLNLGSGGNVSFLSMLSEITGVIATINEFTPTGIRFDSKRNELRIQASAKGFQAFEKFKTEAERLGYEVQQGSLNNDEGVVAGAMTLRSRG